MGGSVSGGKQKSWETGTVDMSGTTSETYKPIISDEWLNQNLNLGNLLGSTGMTSAQQENINALQNVNNGFGAYTQAGYYGLDQFADRFGGGWAAPTDVAAQNISTGSIGAPTIASQDVAAQQGAANMAAYANPFERDVVNASIADYNVNTDRTLNAMRAGRDAAGAFGDRAAIADAVYQADAARGLGSVISNLRAQGFNTAADLGQQDANRFLAADTANAANQLTAASTNAANALAAQQFNNSLRNERQQFDINAAFQGDQNRMQAFRDQQAGIQTQNAIQQAGLDNLLAQLNLGVQTFGRQTDGTSSANTQSSGTSGSKSKGGGFSF